MLSIESVAKDKRFWGRGGWCGCYMKAWALMDQIGSRQSAVPRDAKSDADSEASGEWSGDFVYTVISNR